MYTGMVDGIMSKPDEAKALIAKLRDYRIREQPHRFFLDVADALERDHTIVERVKEAIYREKGLGCNMVLSSDLEEIIEGPAEQPPRGECEHEWHKGDPGQEICVLCPASRSERCDEMVKLTNSFGGLVGTVVCRHSLPCPKHSDSTG